MLFPLAAVAASFLSPQRGERAGGKAAMTGSPLTIAAFSLSPQQGEM
jgi:hypothetical protein